MSLQVPPDESAIARRLRTAVFGGAVVLIVLITAWRLQSALAGLPRDSLASRPHGGLSGHWVGELMLLAVLLLPLCLALPRLRAGHRRTYAWATLAVIPYLVVALVEAVANPAARAWAAGCLFLAFSVFVLLIAYLRATRRLG